MLRYNPSLDFRPADAPSSNTAVVQNDSRAANSPHVSGRYNTEPLDLGVANCMVQSQLQSMLNIVRETNCQTGAAVPLGEFLKQIQRERDEFEAASENLLASAAARLMESLVQTLLDSQPTSNISKATQTDALEITTGYKSEATQTDAVQSPKVYGSKATQTDTPYAPTPKEGCKKVENDTVQLPMAQQSPRGSRTDQTDVTLPVSIQPVSKSIQNSPEFGPERSPELLELPWKRTLPSESFTPERVQTGHSDRQEPPGLARLRQADPHFNIGNGSISVKSTIDEAMERYFLHNSRTLTGARTFAPQLKQTKSYTQASWGMNSSLENEDTSTRPRKLVNGRSPFEDTVDCPLDTARHDVAARSSTSIGLPYGSTSMSGSIMGNTLRTRNGVNEVNRSSISETEDFNGFRTRKAAAETLFARGELRVCLPGYAPLHLTPPTTPRRTSADVISMSREEVETPSDVRTLPEVTCLEMVEKQRLKSADVSGVVVNGPNAHEHNFNGHDRTGKEPKPSPRKHPILVSQKKLHVENAGQDRFLSLLDLVKRK